MKYKFITKITKKRVFLKYKTLMLSQKSVFLVHILTASGSFLAFLSLVAANEKKWTSTWAWLGIALLVDTIDGPIARYLNVKYILPSWSGELLDNIVDYLTYVLIPAFALYQSDLMNPLLSFFSAACIVITSAIYYADTNQKTKENFFKGFPVVWNMMIFTLFILQITQWFAFSIIFISSILSFLPINFIHPFRVKKMRILTNFVVFIWGISGIMCIFYYNMETPVWIRISILTSGLYLYFIGAILQISPIVKKFVFILLKKYHTKKFF